MKNILLCLLVVIFCGMSSSALADGNELLKRCKYYLNEGQHKTKLDNVKGEFCLHNVRSVYNVIGILSAEEGVLNHKYRVCFPDGITYAQAVRIVVKFLEDHPEGLHESEEVLIMSAFMVAYSCK